MVQAGKGRGWGNVYSQKAHICNTSFVGFYTISFEQVVKILCIII